MKLLTTKQAAERLGVSIGRVHQLINEGRLPAEKLGRDYVIREEDLKLVEGRKVGRPPKAKIETDSKTSQKKSKKK
jgi:excisionase family DNA binding protein